MAYYVATNGNDSNPGTEAQPWRTIQKAANTLTAGQTVFVKAGTYNEQVTVQNSGSTGNYITLSAYPGDTVIVDGTGINMNPGYGRDGGVIQIWGKSYIKVTGFTVINSGFAGLFANTPGEFINPPSHDIIFEGNTVKDSWAAAIIMFGRGSSNAENYVARNNTIIRSHIGGDPMAHETLSVGVRISNFEISGNIIKDSFWGGIDAKDGAYNGKIFRNICTNTEMSCVYIDGNTRGASGIDIYENVVHDMVSKDADDVNSGFSVASEEGGVVENIRFYNNIAYNNPGAAMMLPWYSKGIVRNIKIMNNTFYRNGLAYSNRGGLSLEYLDATGILIKNNIFSQNNQFQISNNIGGAVAIENNLIDGYRGYGSEMKGVNFVEGDPLFVNSAIGDFHLRSGSPAIDKGNPTLAVALDFDGISRPQGAGFDIGAFEYKSVTGAIPVVSYIIQEV